MKRSVWQIAQQTRKFSSSVRNNISYPNHPYKNFIQQFGEAPEYIREAKSKVRFWPILLFLMGAPFILTPLYQNYFITDAQQNGDSFVKSIFFVQCTTTFMCSQIKGI